MKRADIAVGKEYACKVRGWFDPRRCVVREVLQYHVVTTYQRRSLIGSGTVEDKTTVRTPQVLMPWPEYEAQQKAKAERDRAVREERHRHAQLVEAQIDEQWAVNLQLQELRGELAARGVENYKHSGHGVTLSWADLAKVLGMKAP